jgi:hypothetical protein
MKVKFLLTAAVICVLGFANAAKADTVSLSTGVFNWSEDSIGGWGTVFSDVEKEAYFYRATSKGTPSNDDRTVTAAWYGHETSYDTVDTFNYRLRLMKNYLAGTLGSSAMTTTGATGALASAGHSLVTHSTGNAENYSHNSYGNIYGEHAELLKGNWTTSGLINQMLMYRNGATLNNIITSSASPGMESTTHNWVYNSATDSFTSDSSTTSNGIGDHNTGIYAFVKGFNYSGSSDAFQYLNGWFSELGFLFGVFINGVELTADYLTMSADFADSRLIRNHDMEIDLAALFADGILKIGNNNIAFVINSVVPEYYGGNIYDGNDGLVAFASGLQLNTESIFAPPPPPPPATPEPATLLILGAGLVGLGIRKRLSTKK